MANRQTDNLLNEMNALFDVPPAPVKAPAPIKGYEFKYNDAVQEIDAVFSVKIDYTTYKLGSFGDIIGVVGYEKSRKSTALGAIISAGIGRKKILNFQLDLRGRNMVYIDTEQAKHRFQKMQKKILQLAGVAQDVPNYRAFQLRGLTIEERRKFIENIMQTTPNVGVLAIDGLVDLCTDFNASQPSRELMQWVMELSDKYKCLIFAVLHLNPGSNKVRGHLGTELQNKCDTIIQTKKPEDSIWTELSCRIAKDVGFTSFEFCNNAYGFAVLDLADKVGEEFETHTDNASINPFF